MAQPLPQISAVDRRLLKTRLCDLQDLKAGVEATTLAGPVRALRRELKAAGFEQFSPDVYFGDEWFSPAGVPAIALPFYLAHPRLAELERAMMTEVEGGSRAWCMKLLRHEAGHCFDHAYELSARRDFRQVFGEAPKTYRPDVYLPDAASRDFVRHLPGFYAQSHPDEDFAETFAVVLADAGSARARYRNWPKALKKVRFVERLIASMAKREPKNGIGPRCYRATHMRVTLGEHYARRKEENARHLAAVKKLTLGRRAAEVSGPH